MRITDFKVTNIDTSVALEEYTEKKLAALDKLCSKYSPCDVAVEIGKNTTHHHKGQVYFAEFNLTIPGGLLRATSTKEDLYEAIDDAKDDLKRQLVDWKERA
jgi:ribosomal subunit interface protein